MSKTLLKIKKYCIPLEIECQQFAFLNQGIGRCISVSKTKVHQLSLKFNARLVYKNGTPIIFESNITDKMKQFVDKQSNKDQNSFIFQFQNNNLIMIYSKKVLKKIINNEIKEEFIQKTKKVFEEKVKEIKYSLLKTFIFAGIAKNNVQQSSKFKKTQKQIKKIRMNSFLKQKSLRLQIQKEFEKIISQDCVVHIQNIFQSTMKVILQPKVPQKTEMINKLRVRNNPKKKYEQQKNNKQLNQLTDVLNQVLNEMINNVYKDIKISQDSTNLYTIINRVEESQIVDLEIIGGVSIVQRINNAKFKLVAENQQPLSHARQQIHQQIAKKKFKQNSQMKNTQNNKRRFIRQLSIVRYLCQKSHKQKLYIPFYYSTNNESTYYCNWYPISLSSYLQTLKQQSDKFQIDQVIELCIQVVLIIIDLHSSGVVHRDLKPSNFVIDVVGSRPRVKLIDFSQSMIIQNQGKQVRQQSLTVYSTPLYCPLEASTFSKNYMTLGLINPQIDRWSVGVLLYQIFYRFLPISYSSVTLKDIHSLWQTEFLEHMNMRGNSDLDKIKQIFEFLSFKLIKVDQQQRLQLQKVLAILLLCKKFYNKITVTYLSH